MKITKLSMAAAIAVSCISSASAKDLTEAIKNVDVSGTVAYRYNDYEGSTPSNNYKIATTLKSKVNDDITANTRIIIGDKTNPASLDTSTSDSEASFSLSEVNFAYTGIANTTIIAGKQALATPFTISRDAMGNEQTGTGIVATTNAGPVSLTGGYFNQTNANDGDTGLTIAGEDMYFVAASVSLGGIVIDSAYTDLDEQFDAYTLGLSANYKVSGVSLSPYARYSALDLESSDKDNSLWKVGMGANAGIFGAYLAYGQTNEEGGIVGIDGSSDTGMDDHWRVTLSNVADASAIYASVNAQVTEKINLALKYSDLDAGSLSASKDQNEVYAQAVYQMSKNFMTFARLGQYENDGQEYTSGRLHMQYAF